MPLKSNYTLELNATYDNETGLYIYHIEMPEYFGMKYYYEVENVTVTGTDNVTIDPLNDPDPDDDVFSEWMRLIVNDTSAPTIVDGSGNLSATTGETANVWVRADDNVDPVSAILFYKRVSETEWSSAEMMESDNRFNYTIEIEHAGKYEKVQAKKFLIATGSRPKLLPSVVVDGKKIITSDDILKLKKFPERMIIIGSGIIGTEYATIFSNFRQTEVHLLDRQHRVIPFEDDDVSDFVSKNLEDNGVIIHHTANLRTIRQYDDYLEVVLDYKDGHSQVLEMDLALISIGRVPNTDDLGLENIGVVPDKRGFLEVDEYLRVKNKHGYKNIYASGDITGETQLYSVAEMQGRFAIRAMYNKVSYPLNFLNMPTLMFFKPEVAAVGLNEKQLQEQGIPYKMAFYSNQLINRAIAMRHTNGFIKIMASDDGQERILGMRASGPQASAFIVSIAHIINQKNSIDQVLRTIHPHPSITEGIQDCLRVLKDKSVYKPYIFPHLIKTRQWKGN